jgi:hypothetical protein
LEAGSLGIIKSTIRMMYGWGLRMMHVKKKKDYGKGVMLLFHGNIVN